MEAKEPLSRETERSDKQNDGDEHAEMQVLEISSDPLGILEMFHKFLMHHSNSLSHKAQCT